MNGSWEYYAKWNNSDGKGQEPYDFTKSNKWTNKQINL